MTTLTITAKGQITLRRELLQYLGIAPGQQVEVHKQANGVLALRAKIPQGLEAFAGRLPPPPKILNITETNDLINDSWATQSAKTQSALARAVKPNEPKEARTRCNNQLAR